MSEKWVLFSQEIKKFYQRDDFFNLKKFLFGGSSEPLQTSVNPMRAILNPFCSKMLIKMPLKLLLVRN